ncbi:endonuclease/exonuclease/phosphatase family protein [Nitrosomonas communis]|uniref:endonuclease/exonuclease/phosphatase family protein n=1 Tax=Nitrosomonas communis TaxID=44574 RepID=UPI003D27B15D
MTIIFLITSVILVFATALPICRYDAWWIRNFDFPRLQLFILIIFTLILEFLLLDLSSIYTQIFIVAAFSCLIYQAWWIIPYTLLFPVEVKTSKCDDTQKRIRIIIANVLMSNRNAEGLIELVHDYDTDVLVTLETNLWWQMHLSSLETVYPYRVSCPLDNKYGMHIYSKFEMINPQIEYLVEPDKPSIHALILLPSGHKIRIHFVHPAPPSPTENEASSERDAELLIIARSVAETSIPVIVTGDLNDVAWSKTTRLFRKISGLLDPRIGRGMYNTFHAGYWFLRWPLDHLFHSKHFKIKRIIRLRNFGSDHFPLFTELVLEGEPCNEINGLDADAADIAWAKAKVRSQNVSKNDVP